MEFCAKLSLSKRLKLYLFENFESDNFAYVLYPFLCIFKIFGFVPINLKNGNIFRDRGKQEYSTKAWILSIMHVVLYIVGFVFAVKHLLETHVWLRLHEETVIAFYTSWIQIASIFIIGAVAVISSWIHLTDMRRLCNAIFKIDQQLNSLRGIKIDYKQLRQRLFMEFAIVFIVPASLSMVNCIILQPSNEEFVLTTSCFWFICFAPIMLLTFKEFQFCNLLYILKLKFELVNRKLEGFGGKHIQWQETDPISNADILHYDEKPNVESIEKLLRIYAKLADAVDLLLRIFSSHLVLLTTVAIGVIIIQCYNLFALSVNTLQMRSYQVFFVISWILVQMTVIGVNIEVCSATFKRMSETGCLLHQIRRPTTSTDSELTFNHLLQIFSLEVLQRKHVFSAAGFFDMNYKLITSIIASVTTYLVIIIQFHFNNAPGSQQNKANN